MYRANRDILKVFFSVSQEYLDLGPYTEIEELINMDI